MTEHNGAGQVPGRSGPPSLILGGAPTWIEWYPLPEVPPWAVAPAPVPLAAAAAPAAVAPPSPPPWAVTPTPVVLPWSAPPVDSAPPWAVASADVADAPTERLVLPWLTSEPVDGHPIERPVAITLADEEPDSAQRRGDRYVPRHRHRHRRAERQKAPWWELPALVGLAIVIAILVKSFIVQPFYIPSQSMEKTLHGCPGCHGDRILVNKVIYDFRDPEPGDIVVFNAPPGWEEPGASKPPSDPFLRVIRGFGQLIGFVPPDGQILVKRVIAVGGQTVKGDAYGNVFVSSHGPDGPYRRLQEPFVFIDPGATTQPANDESHNQLGPFGPVSIPKGRIWVMGDHRNDSADSRYHCDGSWTDCNPVTSTVPDSDVIGKAFVIAWPPSRWRTLGTPPTFEQSAMAAAEGLPGWVSAGLVLPIFVTRARRRRR